MKSTFLSISLLTVFLAVGISSNAQFTYGLQTGLNYSAQSDLGNLNYGNNLKPGFVFGVKTDYQLNNVLTLGTELAYQNKGGQSVMTVDGEESTVERSSNYITVPVLLSAGFSEQLGLQPEWKVYGSFGTYYGWLLNSNDYAGNSDVTAETDINNAYFDTDWGLVYGMGVSYDYGKFGVFGELRYDMGLAKVVTYNTDLRNKTIALTVGVNF